MADAGGGATGPWPPKGLKKSNRFLNLSSNFTNFGHFRKIIDQFRLVFRFLGYATLGPLRELGPGPFKLSPPEREILRPPMQLLKVNIQCLHKSYLVGGGESDLHAHAVRGSRNRELREFGSSRLSWTSKGTHQPEC